jgi:hypothetical protein
MSGLVVKSFDIVWAFPEDKRWSNEQHPPTSELGKAFQKVLLEYYSDERSQRIGLSEIGNDKNHLDLLVRYRFHTNVMLHFDHYDGTYTIDDVLAKCTESLEKAMGILRDLTKDEEKLNAMKKEAYPCLFLKDFSDGIENDGLRGTVSRNKTNIAHLLLQETSDWNLELSVVEGEGIFDNLSYYQHAILMISDQALLQLQVKEDPRKPDLYRNAMLFTICNVANEIAHSRMLKSLYGKLRRALSREDASKTLAKIKSDALVQLYEYSRTEEGIYSGAKSLRKKIRALWDIKELQNELIQALGQLSSVIQERELGISNVVLSILTIAAATGSLVAIYQYLSGGLLNAVQVIISTIVLIALVWLILPPFLRRRAIRE